MEWINEIDVKMLPEPYRQLSPLIGIDNVLRIAEEFQGTSIYFPKLDGTMNRIRDKKIRDEYDGNNIKYLAKKYGLTEVWIRQILTDNMVESNQISLFE